MATVALIHRHLMRGRWCWHLTWGRHRYTSVRFRLYYISPLTLLVVVRLIVLGDLGVVDLEEDQGWPRNKRWYRGKSNP